MKRAITDDAEPAKRVKVVHSTVFSDEVPEQSPTDIIQNGVDEEKWITGKFKMVYPVIEGRIEAIAAVYSSGAPANGLVLQIFFQLNDKFLSQLEISPLNEFRLSLRGAEVKEAPRKANICTLSMQLVFSRGVHILWKPQGVDLGIKTLNTFSKTPTRSDNSWYNSSGDEREEQLLDEVSSTPYVISRATEESTMVIQPDPYISKDDVAKQNKKRQRAEIKRQKREATAKAEAEAKATNAMRPQADMSDTLADSATAASSKQSKFLALRPSSSPAKDYGMDTLSDIRHGGSPNSSVSHASHEQHRREPTGRNFSRYSPLSKIRLGQYTQISGIVVEVSDVKSTTRGELMCYLVIVDQNSTREYGSGKWNGLKVNCFTKRHKEWLPNLRLGDVVILRDVKIEEYHDKLMGVGQPNRLRWAAYSPDAGEIYYGPPNNAPKEENLADGFGAPFSPFYEADATDIQHCISLSDWWRKLVEKDLSESVVPIPKGPSKRLHRLLSETGPNVQPNGYFDCTVEVVKLFIGLQGIHSLFVTDYTPSPGSGASNKSWPASLNEYVLQFEIWDEAAHVAEAIMKPGEYYTINNARMRLNKAGYMEGKVVQAKITQLEENDAENNRHLKALLKRKGEWNSRNSTDVDAFLLIQDAKVGKFFDCIVELVHIESKPHQIPKLYVTDYSGKSRLASNCDDQPWSRDLEGRIVQIMLDEEQKHVAESASVGTVFSIRKLRLKFNAVENGICGILGGSERLIVPMNINRSDNNRLNDLIHRKEDWMKGRQQYQQNRTSSKSTPVPDDIIRFGDAYTRIRDMPLQDTDIDRYRLVAKVVDFYPMELKDAFYQKCSSCNKEIPEMQKACAKCGDFDHEFLGYFYQMFILIEDQVGDQIKLSISDKCSLLDGLKRAHLGEDSSALRAFSARLNPLLGDLSSMHDGLQIGQVVKVENSLLCFEIDTWIMQEASKATRAFGLCAFAQI